MRLREIFPKIGKRLTPIIKEKKGTYSNSSFNLWKEKKYAIELIPVKFYRKGFIFFVAKTVKDITNHLLMLAKVFSQCLSLFQCFPLPVNKKRETLHYMQTNKLSSS